MDYHKIYNETYKYNYVICSESKCEIISSSDSRKEATDELKEYLGDNLKKWLGEEINLIIFREIKNWKDSILIPYPIFFEIMEYYVEKGEEDEDDYVLRKRSRGINSNVFITEKYLKKNKKIRTKDVLKMVKKFRNLELKKGLMTQNLL